jgi:3-oxoacyl-[acyl-carrier protein] reductase
MTEEFAGRVAFVTGAARGIGLAVVKTLVARGAQAAMLDVDADALHGAARALGAAALPIVADVSCGEEVSWAVQTTAQHFGRLDILVNNAGICPMTAFESILEEEWERVLAINLKGAFLCCQAALPHLRRSGKQGRIITIASIAGQMGGVSVAAHYAASKGGVIALTKCLASRLAPDGITVNCVSPGTTVTDMVVTWSDEVVGRVLARTPLGRLAQPEEIAEAVCYLASDKASFITGATLDINGGLYLR